MSQITFESPFLIHLIWLAVLFVVGIMWLRLGRARELSTLISYRLRANLVVRPGSGSRWVYGASMSLMLLFGIVALMRPQGPATAQTTHVGERSADIMVVLDLSKSMLAEDTAPNRLGRAKAEINELVDHLGGHRVGLVGFAGRASLLCPLTADHGFFELSMKGAMPETIGRGGTRIGEALTTAVRSFDDGQASRLILLVTDGEDHDSYPLEAAEQARESGIPVVAIGFGSEDGSPITLTDPETGASKMLQDSEGNVVNSALDGDTLREIALRTEGIYVPAGTKALDLESIVADHIEPIVRSNTEDRTKMVPSEEYLPLVLLSLFSMLMLVWAGGRAPGVVS